MTTPLKQTKKSADWAAIKPTTPFGQVPVLYVDSKPLAESAAIAAYAAKLGGLMPDDPWKAAKADEAFFFTDDLMKVSVFSVFSVAFHVEVVVVGAVLCALTTSSQKLLLLLLH